MFNTVPVIVGQDQRVSDKGTAIQVLLDANHHVRRESMGLQINAGGALGVWLTGQIHQLPPASIKALQSEMGSDAGRAGFQLPSKIENPQPRHFVALPNRSPSWPDQQ